MADSSAGEPPFPLTGALAPLLARLDELEIKLSFAEDLLESLNALVARQADQIDALGREVARLKERTERGDAGTAAGGHSASDDRPPHY